MCRRLLKIRPRNQRSNRTSVNRHPTRTAIINYDDKDIGFIGQLHPQYSLDNDLGDVYVFELDITQFIDMEKDTKVFFPIPKLPNIERDISIVIDKDIHAVDIVNKIKNTEKKSLVDVIVFDVYTGINVGENQKSLALNLKFVNDGDLTDDIINSKIKRIVKELNASFNASLRS